MSKNGFSFDEKDFDRQFNKYAKEIEIKINELISETVDENKTLPKEIIVEKVAAALSNAGLNSIDKEAIRSIIIEVEVDDE